MPNNKNFDKRIIYPIYPNKNVEKPLSDCGYLEFQDNTYIYCNIKNNEIDYFKNDDSFNIEDNTLYYNTDCGYKFSTYLWVYRLNKANSPIFYIQKMILPNEIQINSSTIFVFKGVFEGSLNSFSGLDSFSLFIYIEKKSKKNSSFIMDCNLNSQKNNNFGVECRLPIVSPIKKKKCVKFYIFPYFIPNTVSFNKFEIIISDKIEILNEYKKEGIKYDIKFSAFC